MKKIPKSIIFILGIITGIAITGGYYYFSNEVKKENHLPEFWDAEGMYQNYDFPTRQAEDILSDCQNLFFVFNPDGKGEVRNGDSGKTGFNFDWVENGDILTINDGSHQYTFQKFNNNTFICNYSWGNYNGIIKLRRKLP